MSESLSGFDPATYLALNPDIARAGADPVRHYLTFGRKENRRISDALVPTDSEDTPNRLRLALFGTCIASHLEHAARGRVAMTLEHHLFGGTAKDLPEIDTGKFDAIVVHVTMRYLFDDVTGNGDLFHVRPDTDFGAVTSRAVAELQHIVERFEAGYATRIPVFFLAFVEPPPTLHGLLVENRGRSLYRCVRELNDALSARLADSGNMHYVEINDLRCFFGDAAAYDGYLGYYSHGAFWDFEPSLTLHVAILMRIERCLRALKSADKIKLIITDLDNTLWNGVLAEQDDMVPEDATAGWPIGYVEALLEFKRRGGLLAICSKNERQATLANLRKVWGSRITSEDFCSIWIDWNPKSGNIARILQETNLEPRNVLFVDDNPLEIAEVRANFPTMRMLTGEPTDWRRVILYSSETQTKGVSEESRNRTEMVRAKVAREAHSARVGREAYLDSLDLQVDILLIRRAGDARFPRAFELINKTNQFNTTGRRWSQSEMAQFFATGGVLVGAAARDRFGQHGLVGIAVVHGADVRQVVLSCRVFGLGIETCLLHFACKLSLAGPQAARDGLIKAAFVPTGRNATCADFFPRAGFQKLDDRGEVWGTEAAVAVPKWIRVSNASESCSRAPAREEQEA